ncbi:MAG: MBL fold metallo-hydrolase [Desulfotomaculaceae bacterium]|nr:MBL fold metallo-hydrolase [Desulfotomaculaceae bacterium]
MALIFDGFSVGPWESNCYIVGCGETKEGAVVDPGADATKILNRVKKLGLKINKIILTHGHPDHISALEEVQQATGAKVLIHSGDAGMLTDARQNLSLYMGKSMEMKAADVLLKDGDTIQVGNINLEVMHTPGHSNGGICLKCARDVVITGDTLFAGSVGRSDFPGGSHTQLINSIKDKLLKFPPVTKVYPGHGPASTIGAEMRNNPFLNGAY